MKKAVKKVLKAAINRLRKQPGENRRNKEEILLAIGTE